MRVNKGYAYAFMSVFCMVMSTLISSMVISDVSDIVASTINVAVVLVILMLTYGLNKDKINIKKPNRNIIMMGILSLIGIIFMYESIRLLGASTYSFLSRISVIFSLFIGIYILNEKTNVSYVGIILTIIGIVIMQFTDISKESVLGIITTVIFTFCFSISNAIAKKEVSYTADEKLFYNNIISIIPLSLINIINLNNGAIIKFTAIDLIVLMISAILSSFFGMRLFFKAIEKIDFTTVTIIRTFNPVMVMLLSALFFTNQTIKIHELIGGMVIFVGIMLVVLKKFKEPNQ